MFLPRNSFFLQDEKEPGLTVGRYVFEKKKKSSSSCQVLFAQCVTDPFGSIIYSLRYSLAHNLERARGKSVDKAYQLLYFILLWSYAIVMLFSLNYYELTKYGVKLTLSSDSYESQNNICMSNFRPERCPWKCDRYPIMILEEFTNKVVRTSSPTLLHIPMLLCTIIFKASRLNP